MSDVSLCILRIEKCFYSSIHRSGEASTSSEPVSGPSSSRNTYVRTLRGLREVCDIKIENYVPQKLSVESTVGSSSMSSSSGAVPKSVIETISFVSGNPFVEVTKGIIHLFKEDERTDIKRAAQRSTTICILAIPSTMTCADVLSFTASFHQDTKHLRIIKGNTPNQYMTILTFRTPDSAEQFYLTYNGVPFNCLEPDFCCNLVFVSRVESLSEADGGGLPPPAHTELPTCPVCLERMDESVDGILTIMCNHSFHGECLSKWGDTSCPVCRYVQTPEPSDEGCCLECMATESLWICLICGHVGCGRYLRGHAYQHYVDTHHCYSMQIGTNRVWDYVGDNFVHRLLQNDSDGKLVEGPPPAKSEEKIETVHMEFTYLLSSQLESQRQYYEELMNAKEAKYSNEASALVGKNDALMAENNAVVRDYAKLAKEKNSLEKKLQLCTAKLNQAQKDLVDEQNLNKQTRENINYWQEKCENLEAEFKQFRTEKDSEIQELREELRDVLFFIEAQKAITQRADKDEIQEGRIEVGKPMVTTTKPSRRRRKKT